jgi:hypothetical protein
MFSGAISVRILSENQILSIRSKTLRLAEKTGFDKSRAYVLSAFISDMARLILSQTATGRIDVLSVRAAQRAGVTIMAFLERLEKNEILNRMTEKMKALRKIDLESLTAKNVIDEYKIYPGENREVIMQITKWI